MLQTVINRLLDGSFQGESRCQKFSDLLYQIRVFVKFPTLIHQLHIMSVIDIQDGCYTLQAGLLA